MKLSFAGLIVLGLVAALSAAVLVSHLTNRVRPADAGQAANTPDVRVVVARKTLPAMAIVQSGDVDVRTVPRNDAPEGFLSDPGQVVGKPLTTPMVADKVFTRNCFAAESEGLNVAAFLPDGRRAVSISLPSDRGLERLLYPGSIVDVFVSLQPHSAENRQMDPIAVTLLQGIQVLAVENRTIVANGPTAPPADASSASQRPTQKLIVTLNLDSKQAKTLELAMANGEISLAMRNPLDSKPADTGVISLSELMGGRPAGENRSDLTALLDKAQADIMENVRKMMAENRPAPAAKTDNRPAPAAEPPAMWQATVIRGTQMETRAFPAGAADGPGDSGQK